MKRSLSMFLAVMMVFGLAACGAKTEETVPVQETAAETAAAEEAAGETAGETEAAAAAGLANPMTEITDSAEFLKDLGIEIDGELLYSEAKLFIIDGRIAECQFSFENAAGEPVACTFRATKDEETSKNLHGIYDSTLKEFSDIDYVCDGEVFNIKVSANDAETVTVYTWQYGDVWYSLALEGNAEGSLAEVLESALLAAGIDGESYGAAESGEASGWYELSEDETVLTVRLDSNPTTGFQWSWVIENPDGLELISEEYQQTPGTEGLQGAGGTWTASFRSTGTDGADSPLESNSIRFTYSRQWEEAGLPEKVIDLLVTGTQLEVFGVHEPDLAGAQQAEDGEYEMSLEFFDMIRESEQSSYGLVGLPEVLTWTEEEVKALKVGDVISLSGYGLDDITVECIDVQSDTSIRISECERFVYDSEKDAWVIIDWDDYVYKKTGEKRLVHFTGETVIEDSMETVMQTGNTGTLYERMAGYLFVEGKITVKDGQVSKIIIYYHS